MSPSAIQSALLALALAGCALCAFTPAGALVAVAALAALVGMTHIQTREAKVLKEQAAALLRVEARLSTVERTLANALKGDG